ncbi:hypothetical protein M231_01169 [Tremella mesenterica]|uniref:Nicotinamide riboside kinase n=1 Tax=Tremella mesenterica TaxID=5217 RepID=A0A4Q1BTQ3_TREME|nr:hypothetical protein M231_01169 [Tremella mesenterica]
MRRRVVIIGIGGASCSGKTLLAKHIRSVLPPGSTIVHQDDFVPPIDQVPYSDRYPDLQDWDDPPTCVIWPDFRACLKHVRRKGVLPDHHSSHDHLNKQVEIPLDPQAVDRFRIEFQRFNAEMNAEGTELVWFLVDGFVLYWDREVIDQMDVRILLKVPHDLLKQRREERQVYVLQNPDDAAGGGVWVDPPNYFDKIVYPAYVKAHDGLFDGGVETETLKREWEDRLFISSPSDGAEEMVKCFTECCEEIIRQCREGAGAFLLPYKS